MQVKNFTSNSYNAVANQFRITFENCEVFQSYQSIIAVRFFGHGIVLDTDKWDYSKTTGKYRNEFTGMDKKETLKAIQSGKILLADLKNVDFSTAKFSDFAPLG